MKAINSYLNNSTGTMTVLSVPRTDQTNVKDNSNSHLLTVGSMTQHSLIHTDNNKGNHPSGIAFSYKHHQSLLNWIRELIRKGVNRTQLYA
jgi:hypothetical protein